MSVADPPLAQAPVRCDLAIVGGGIVGLAVARELTRRRPRASICLLEREPALAAHQTGHSSGVIHAGIYYRPGSLKARLCVSGAQELYRYCAEHGIAHERSGKLILATHPRELGRLDELHRRGQANGVDGLRQIAASEIQRIEPHAQGLSGLHSPGTGVVDFRAVARAYARDVLEAGATIAGDCQVTGVHADTRALRLTHSHGTTEAAHAIFCAGAWADRLAVAAGADPEPRIVPFRGAYLRLRPDHRQLVRSLVYPVPNPSLPFLGVHFTRHLDGEVLIGPTALIAGARDAYRLSRIRRSDLHDTLTWPGTWRLLARFWPAALGELHRSALPGALVRTAQRFVPELQRSDVEPASAGVRAQALARNGRLLDDFAFSATGRALHVRNAPSPAATASLAIARHIVDCAERELGL